MSLGWLLLIFLAELLVLFFLARSVTTSVGLFFYRLTRSRDLSINLLAIIFLPGTILHELAHIISAGMLLVPTGEIEVFPEIDGDRVRLGSAQIGQTDMLRRLIIGVAPVLVGLLVMLSVLFLARDWLLLRGLWWQTALVLYVVFEISNTMFSSKKDMEGAAAFLGAIAVVAGLVIGGIYLLGYSLPLSWMDKFNQPLVREFLQKADLFLLVPLGIDLFLLSLSKVFNRGYQRI